MAQTEADGAVGAEDGHTHERSCLNCGTALVGDYCHGCGQRAHVHRTLTAFWHDLAHGVLHFEGRIWRTLPLLAWQPGELTRRYIDGERARFVSPIALFLFAVFVTFAVVNFTGTLETTPQGRAAIARSAAQTERDIATFEASRARAAAAGADTAELDRRIAEERRELAALNGLAGMNIGLGRNVAVTGDLPDWFRRPIEEAAANPALLVYKLKSNAYKYSWALIPLSVPFVWLLFPFSRRFRLYDHIVFVTYSLSFMMLLLVAAYPVAALLGGLAGWLALIPPVHMYRQLKDAYALSRAGAAWRTLALLLFASVAALLFIILLVALGLFD